MMYGFSLYIFRINAIAPHEIWHYNLIDTTGGPVPKAAALVLCIAFQYIGTALACPCFCLVWGHHSYIYIYIYINI